MERLTYKEYKGCKDILTIDLHNGYTIIAIKSWNKDREIYNVEFRITENTVDKWDLIEEDESVYFSEDYKTINSSILKYVASNYSDGYYSYYIERYRYELYCFDTWNTVCEMGMSNISDT